MLQSKPIRRGESRGLGGSRQRVRDIQERAHRVSSEFASVCRALASSGIGAQAAVDSLSRQLSLFFLDCRERVVPPGPPLPGLLRRASLRGEEEQGEIQQCEERLLFLCDTLSSALARDTANPTKLAQVLGSTFSSVVELMLGQEVQSLLSKLKPGPRLLPAIAALTDLALEGNNLCRLLVGSGAITSLTSLLSSLSNPDPALAIAALRCLGCLCCVGEGVAALLEVDGLAIVLATLGEERRGESERREAAGVVAQLTSPWVEEPACMEALEASLPCLLAALRDLALATTSMETFLLCTAALANLTSVLPSAAELLLASGLLPPLLCHPAASSSSPYIQDQVVTLVANMARLASARVEMVDAGVVPMLLSILHQLPAPDPALALARQRSLAKAAIALARVSLEQATADAALRLGALDTLARLATREGQGETVGMAALAAARSLSVASRGEAAIVKLGGEERAESFV